jgi:predicted PhzF superfamily epimerase YddE/YHI9
MEHELEAGEKPLAGLYGVFAEQPGRGSVAGVVVSHAPISRDRMQAIAGDFAAPTTGFATVGMEDDGAVPIRFSRLGTRWTPAVR